MTVLGRLWWLVGCLAAPALPVYLRRRAAGGKEIRARLPERWGRGVARPPGRLLWLHAASVGETLSILPVLQALAELAPDLAMLVTTGTVTSARLLAERLPASLAGRVQHRFLPLDVPGWVARFLDGWRPDAGCLVESELWPNLLAAAAARGVPMALVNGRISKRSARRWGRVPDFAAALLGCFQLVLARSEADAERLRRLGAPAARHLGNLKDVALPLPADPARLAALRAGIGARPVLLGASTHPGEEAQLVAAHRLLAERLPGLLTVLVPRHPERGPAVAAAADGLATERRAAGALPGPGIAIYVADTLGELGLFYRLAGAALVGGSLVPHGGQNPLEPARLGCPILLGPHTANFADTVARLEASGGCVAVPAGQPAALARAAGDVLSNPAYAARLAAAATAALAGEAGLAGQVANALIGLLPPRIPGQD